MSLQVPATVNGLAVTYMQVDIPAWGCWYVEANIDSDKHLAGAAEVKISDLVLRGTILSTGDSGTGRKTVRIVAGSGAWSKRIKAKSYQNDVGIKRFSVVQDASIECGERFSDDGDTSKLGNAFVRAEAAASWVLEQVAPQGWYVDELGVTRLGKRKAATLADYTIVSKDLAHGRIVLAPTSIATMLPSASIEGMEVSDVRHELTPDGLRSTLWGRREHGASRRTSALIELMRQIDPDREYRGVTEYRIVTAGDKLDLQAVRSSSGMPDLRRVPVRATGSGVKPALFPGARVLVSFIDSDPSRPFVLGLEEIGSPGFKPISIDIDAATKVSVGVAATPVAHASPTFSILTAIQTLLAGVKAGYDAAPGPLTGAAQAAVWTPLLTALAASFSANSPLIPTTKLEAQ
jgi:hypothetical protein